MKRIVRVLPVILSLFISGCTGLKFVPKGEQLYTGGKVEIIQNGKMKGKAAIKSSAKRIIRPKPNTNILGMRPGLWIYYAMGTPKKKKGLKQFIKNKLGQPPVYLSAMDPGLIVKGIDAGLYNSGYFDSYSQYQIKENKNGKTASLLFKINLSQPFAIRDISFPPPTDTLNKLILRSAKRTLLKKGAIYSLATLVKERERIDAYLKRKGYYYFRPDHILFSMDTNAGERTVNLHVTLKKDMPPRARIIYHIGDVNVYPDFQLGDSAGTQKLVIDSINYFKGSSFIRPRPVLSSVFYKPGQTYSSRIHQTTLNRLNGLGVFKFINIELRDQDTISNGLLSVNIYLTAMPRKSLSVEVQAATKSNNFIGPGLILSLRNRNAFKGAELMVYNLRASFETQYSGEYKGQFTYEFNPKIELTVPRILSAFRVKSAKMYTPHTRFSLEYAYLSRVGYFNMNTVKMSYAYKWKPSAEIDHEIVPASINFYNIYNTSDKFNQLIADNSLIRSRFAEQFIPGVSYSFFYNQQVKTERRNQFYFNGNAELAGNTVALLSWLFTQKPISSSDPSKVLGVNFAQFARFDIDVRDYFHITRTTNLAMRFIAGWGIPYGNSSSLPYARQFFSGGAYSLRGFPGNAVGPGSYAPPDSIKNIFYLQQGGEIKLEFNIEYRFPIYKILKGAVFLDAGNTWLNKANANAPGGEFKWDRFMTQLAISTGAGLRLDLSFFVLRLDLGIPLRNPALPQGREWEIKNLRPSNLLFNLAFGYPF